MSSFQKLFNSLPVMGITNLVVIHSFGKPFEFLTAC